MSRWVFPAAFVLGFASIASAGEAEDALSRIGAPASYAERDPLDYPRVELGRKLAFDPRLSADGGRSCMTCHKPALAFTDGLPRAHGAGQGPRNTPTLLNLHYRTSFFWDGRAASIEEALLAAIKNPVEMNQDPEALAKKLGGIPGYAKEFEEVFGSSGVTVSRLASAIGAFVRAIDADYAERPSAFDRFRDDPSALTPSARRGLLLFAGKAGCVSCHGTNNFADDKFHDVGLPPQPGLVDKGREGKFKTPSLRQSALTAPYMHDGRFATLGEVVGFFDRTGSLGLTGEEQAALVDFLKALSAPTPKVVAPNPL